jgi:hypothetical protein
MTDQAQQNVKPTSPLDNPDPRIRQAWQWAMWKIRQKNRSAVAPESPQGADRQREPLR